MWRKSSRWWINSSGRRRFYPGQGAGQNLWRRCPFGAKGQLSPANQSEQLSLKRHFWRGFARLTLALARLLFQLSTEFIATDFVNHVLAGCVWGTYHHGWHPGHCGVWRDGFEHHAVLRRFWRLADSNVAENSGPALIKTLCPPSDARSPLLPKVTEGDRLHNRHIIVHHRGLTDHNAGVMIEHQPLT